MERNRSKISIQKLQPKYNNIKTNWRKYSDRQKNGLAPEKFPKLFDIINPALSYKNQGLHNIVSCSEDTLILNAAEEYDSGEASDEDDN